MHWMTLLDNIEVKWKIFEIGFFFVCFCFFTKVVPNKKTRPVESG